MNTFSLKTFATVAGALLLMVSSAFADGDVKGSKDYPLIGRYEGSTIYAYKNAAFDETSLLIAPSNTDSDSDWGKGPNWLHQEGKLQIWSYLMPDNRSSLEIYRNVTAKIEKSGFQTVFECTDDACVTGHGDQGMFGILLGRHYLGTSGDVDTFTHARYRVSKLSRPEGDVYVSILAGEPNGGGRQFFWQEVVEAKAMDTNKMVFVDAPAMEKSLNATGKVTLYGIQFDFNKADIKPESKPTLDEIAKYLTKNPGQKIAIVGYTDNKGGVAFNLDLSKRRADAVAAALASTYGIASNRLDPSGAGMASPVASNDTEDGQAKNRRVELVKE